MNANPEFSIFLGKDILHVPSDRFSPVRRASDGSTTSSNVGCRNHLEKLYREATIPDDTVKALLLEYQQLQVNKDFLDIAFKLKYL